MLLLLPRPSCLSSESLHVLVPPAVPANRPKPVCYRGEAKRSELFDLSIRRPFMLLILCVRLIRSLSVSSSAVVHPSVHQVVISPTSHDFFLHPCATGSSCTGAAAAPTGHCMCAYAPLPVSETHIERKRNILNIL